LRPETLDRETVAEPSAPRAPPEARAFRQGRTT
jgi:hypothetical protein